MATPVSELDLPLLDLMAATSREEREAMILDAQNKHWLAKTPLGYLITRYDDVTVLLRDRRWHQLAKLIAQLNGMENEMKDRRTSILTAEGEEHTRLRRLVAPAFSPRSADRLRPFMRQVINGLADEIVERGCTEFVHDICEPYPIPIICELLGAPKEDWRLFSRWASDLLLIFNNNLREDLPVMEKARVELDAYVVELINDRRAKPADDLLTDLIAAEEAGDRLSAEELLVMVEAVIVAGTDTTRNQLACAIALFTDYPDQWNLLRENPALASTAVEETMRYLGAVRGTGRFASEDVEFNDVFFPKGSLMFVSLVAANFDSAVFETPATFDITRPGIGQQMSFGTGIHYCLGASLARAELQEALPILAERMPNLRRDGDITWKPNTAGIWGPERLPIRFD